MELHWAGRTALQRSHTAQPKYLMRDLTWRMLMSGWAESHRQHDVVEFTAFFLQRHNITLAQGTWHARRLHDGHIQVRDMGQCTQPITLRIPTVPPGLHPTVQVQSLIDFGRETRHRSAYRHLCNSLRHSSYKWTVLKSALAEYTRDSTRSRPITSSPSRSFPQWI